MSSHNRILNVIIAVMLISGTGIFVAAKDNPMHITPTQDITFTAPTLVSGTVLPPGAYKIIHELQGTEHVMIFKSANGKTEVKAKCKLVPLDEKAKKMQQRYKENTNNEHELIEITFRGETEKHVLLQ